MLRIHKAGYGVEGYNVDYTSDMAVNQRDTEMPVT